MKRRGFTLIELLTVIGIIVLLMAILLPVVSKVRSVAHRADTQNRMSVISSAAMMYFHDFNAYPGPVANVYLAGGTKAGMDPIKIQGISGPITSSENLVLGLLGMLTPPQTPGGPITYAGPSSPAPSATPVHDVLSLNYLSPKSYHYIDYIPEQLTPMPDPKANGNSGKAVILEYAGLMPLMPMKDSNVPEFIDSIGNPMPILYMRAQPGAPLVTNKLVAGSMTSGGNPDVDWQYNSDEIAPYGCSIKDGNDVATWRLFDSSFFTKMASIRSSATGLSGDTATPSPNMASTVPDPKFSGYGYLANPNILNAPRGANSFILISAGEDRTYGTADDIIVTP